MDRDSRTELVVQKAELICAFAQRETHHAPTIIQLQNELKIQQTRTWFRNGEVRYFIIHPDGCLDKGIIYRVEDNILYSSLGSFTPEQRALFYEVEDVFLPLFEHSDGKVSQ